MKNLKKIVSLGFVATLVTAITCQGMEQKNKFTPPGPWERVGGLYNGHLEHPQFNNTKQKNMCFREAIPEDIDELLLTIIGKMPEGPSKKQIEGMYRELRNISYNINGSRLSIKTKVLSFASYLKQEDYDAVKKLLDNYIEIKFPDEVETLVSTILNNIQDWTTNASMTIWYKGFHYVNNSDETAWKKNVKKFAEYLKEHKLISDENYNALIKLL